MIKVLNDPKLAKNFRLSEFICKDGSKEVIVIPELIEKLQKLRELLGKSITVVSGYRNSNYNKKIGGATRSQHLYGKAADIKIKDLIVGNIAKAAEAVGFNGIGIYTHNGNNFVHVDVRSGNSYWKDSPSGKLIKIDKIEGKEYTIVSIEQKYASLEQDYARMILKHDDKVRLLFEQINSSESKLQAIENIFKGE